MPRDLFGDVTRPSISIGNRKWYTVPVSLLSHSVIIAMFVVLPILAAPYMPGVVTGSMPDYINITVPPPPSPPKPRLTETKPIENPHAAPVVPPDGIRPESPIDLTPVETTVGVIGGSDDIDRVLAPPPPVVKPPEPAPGPVRISGTIRRPVKIGGSDPVYSPMALAARIQGLVIIEATLSEDGRVINARVLRSLPMLDQAALDAVRTWQYTPTMLNGVPVPVIMTVTVTFTLSR
jgi:protein TonB